jgi:hypothetical protein
MKTPGTLLTAAVFASAGLLLAGTASARPPDARWLADDAAHSDALSPPQRLRIEQQIANVLGSPALRATLATRKAIQAVELNWPLRSNRPGAFGYHGISNYVDHDPAFPSRLRDYACGARTYDNAGGYNHAGTDYFLWPFPWRTMDEEAVSIVAAADGVIVGRSDGNPDRSCATGDAPWNAVYVRHDDGGIAWYGHMKRGSVTAKQPGDSIAAGEYLGLVGSSGSSTGPHLHFELHDAAGRVVDPRHGECNAAPERWSPPQPYEDPAINALSLHDAQPETLSCGVDAGQPVHEETHQIHIVAPGQTFRTFAAFRDHRNGEISRFSLVRPDGSVFADWPFDLASADLPRPFYSATGWVWVHTLPADAPTGYWSYRAEFHGQAYRLDFYVGNAADARATAVRRERAEIARLPREIPAR